MGLESVFVQEDKKKHLFYKFYILGEKMKVILTVTQQCWSSSCWADEEMETRTVTHSKKKNAVNRHLVVHFNIARKLKLIQWDQHNILLDVSV